MFAAIASILFFVAPINLLLLVNSLFFLYNFKLLKVSLKSGLQPYAKTQPDTISKITSPNVYDLLNTPLSNSLLVANIIPDINKPHPNKITNKTIAKSKTIFALLLERSPSSPFPANLLNAFSNLLINSYVASTDCFAVLF